MNRRTLTMSVIEALDTVITNDAMSQYELADAVVVMLINDYGILDDVSEDDEQAPEVRPAPDEHDAERAQALGENYRRSRDLRAALGPGWHLDHQCPFCTRTEALPERLGVHIALTHFRSEPPLPGQVGVPLPSKPKARCTRCGLVVENIQALAEHLAYYHAHAQEPPC